MKKVLTVLLLCLALAGGIAAIIKTSAPPAGSTEGELAETSKGSAPADGVLVTYFTTNVRCPSCKQLEGLTRAAVEADFPEYLATGEVVFQVINIEQPEHAHFI